MSVIDTSTEFGARAARRLGQERIVWLTTVGDDLTPQPSPVWFYWDGEMVLIYSQPNTPKLRNIAYSAKVALHLNTDATGDAQIVANAPPAHEVAPFVAKYRDELRAVQSAEEFARLFEDYTVAVRVTPTRLRGF